MTRRFFLAVLALLLGVGAHAQRLDDPARTVTRSVVLPYKGLFVGDQLGASARERLIDLILEARGLDIEVALLVPSGAWRVDGGGDDDHRLTPARLDAVRRFLVQRGLDPKHIYVESRVDARLSEPRLLVEMVGHPGRH